MTIIGDLMQHLQTYDKALPIDEVLRDPLRPARQSIPALEALRAIRRVQSISSLSSLSHQYQQWQVDPSTFWASQDVSLGSGNLPGIYRGMKQLEVQRQSSTVMWRFFTLFFYNLMLLVGDGRKYMVDSLQKRIAETIDSCSLSLLPASADTISTDLKGWAKAGSKYYNVAARLGIGSLMLLPQNVTDNVWENRLPMKGSCFEDAMTHLLDLGICDMADKMGLNRLGCTLRDMILKQFREFDATSISSDSASTIHDSANGSPASISSNQMLPALSSTESAAGSSTITAWPDVEQEVPNLQGFVSVDAFIKPVDVVLYDIFQPVVDISDLNILLQPQEL